MGSSGKIQIFHTLLAHVKTKQKIGKKRQLCKLQNESTKRTKGAPTVIHYIRQDMAKNSTV